MQKAKGYAWFSDSIVFNFYFFLTIGPSLPKRLQHFSMLEIYEDLYVFGGVKRDLKDFPLEIYRLSCCSEDCRWSIINQELKEARENVAIPVPDYFCT